MKKVKFYIDSFGLFAYFPDEHYHHEGHPEYKNVFTSYAHVGQHSGCHKDYLKGKKLASPEQYNDLLNELKGQGYDDLIVMNKPIVYTIENKTILLPEIIAEGAFWDALEELKTPANPEADYKLQLEIVPKLVERANYHYQNDPLFRKQITSNEKGRNTLWAFMIHWTKSILRKKKLNTTF